ncbi:MAG: hypothetical protein ACKVT2_21530 [Saprospiraceae bacterium]
MKEKNKNASKLVKKSPESGSKSSEKSNSKPVSKAADGLYKKLIASEKNAENALKIYEEKKDAFEMAQSRQSDKLTLKSLLAASKIAKLTYKIKNIEQKLAKATWKSASKATKKSTESGKK